MKSTKQLNILVINYEYPPVGGGGGYICRNVVEELVNMGHQITVLTSKYKNLPLQENVNGVAIYRVPVLCRNKQDTASLPSMLSFVPACILKANELFKANSFDVINTHFAIPSGPAGHYLSKKYNIPNVLDLYGGDVYDPTKFLSPHKTPALKQTVRKMMSSAQRVISDSNDIKNHAIRHYGIEKEIVIIPPGVAPYNGPLKTRKELGLPEDKLILTTLGRLVTRKNNVELIKILHTIKEQVDCHLIIMGEGEDRLNIQREIDNLNLNEYVTLMGRVGDEKFQIMTASDVYVSTATHEGFGLVFLEAMESGLPIICYNNGGQIDFLNDRDTGFIVNLGEVETFTNKLIELLKNHQMRKEVSSYNKNYVKEFYIRKGAEKHLTVYLTAISQDHLLDVLVNGSDITYLILLRFVIHFVLHW